MTAEPSPVSSVVAALNESYPPVSGGANSPAISVVPLSASYIGVPPASDPTDAFRPKAREIIADRGIEEVREFLKVGHDVCGADIETDLARVLLLQSLPR
jgi:hypothetical protein